MATFSPAHTMGGWMRHVDTCFWRIILALVYKNEDGQGWRLEIVRTWKGRWGRSLKARNRDHSGEIKFRGNTRMS